MFPLGRFPDKAVSAAPKLISLWLCLMGPLMLWAPVQSTILFLLMALSALPLVTLGRGAKRMLPVLLALGAVYIGWAALGWLWAPYDQLIGNRIFKFLLGIPFAILLFNLKVEGRDRQKTWLTMALAGYLAAAAILVADLLGGYWLSGIYHQWKGIGYVENMFKPGSSILLIFGVLIGFAALYQKRYRLAALVLVLQIILLTHISVMHAAKLAVPMSLMAYLLISCTPAVGRWALVCLGAFMLLILPLLLTPGNFQLFLEMGVELPPSLLHRLVIWDFTQQLIGQNPLLGYGLGSARFLGEGQFAAFSSLPDAFQAYEVWQEYSAENDLNLLPLHPHNLGLQLILETGFVGAVLFFIMLAFVLWQIAGSCSKPQLKAAFPIMIVILLMANFSFSVWQSWWMAAIFLQVGAARLLIFADLDGDAA